MVGAVEEEPRAAGQRAEFPDDQPVAVHRIVIQHVVAFEIDGVGREIVVDRPVPLAGIYLIFHLFSILCWVKSP